MFIDRAVGFGWVPILQMKFKITFIRICKREDIINGPVWFVFLKTAFCSQKQGEQRKQENTLPFFFVMKNTKKILNSENNKKISENIKMTFPMFSKTVHKYNFKNMNQTEPRGSLKMVLVV